MHTTSTPDDAFASEIDAGSRSPSGNIAMNLPSDAALLIKNLRFLNFDVLPDWPSLTVRTFRTVKDAHLAQRDRLRSAEWVLFRLFEIWDPSEALPKLSPFFPALEPRQSIKLRNALYQCLNQLKARGNLGRECVIRKSTLDECRGAKFEELLLVFSSIVLQKHVRTRTDNYPVSTTAQLSILADPTDAPELECLEPLILVHKKNLDNILSVRKEFQRKAGTLVGTLESTLEFLDARAATTDMALSHYEEAFGQANMDMDRMKVHLQNECSGNTRWLKIMVGGDREQDRLPLIEDTFSNIWKRVISQDKPLNHSMPSKSILVDLDNRIGEQNERLIRWRKFQKTVSERNENFILDASAAKSPRKSPRKLPQNSPTKTPRKKMVNGGTTLQQRTGLETSSIMSEPLQTSTPRPNHEFVEMRKSALFPTRPPTQSSDRLLWFNQNAGQAYISSTPTLIQRLHHEFTPPTPALPQMTSSLTTNNDPRRDSDLFSPAFADEDTVNAQTQIPHARPIIPILQPSSASTSPPPPHSSIRPPLQYSATSLTQRTLATLSRSLQRQPPVESAQITGIVTPTLPLSQIKSVDSRRGSGASMGNIKRMESDAAFTPGIERTKSYDITDLDLVFRTRSKLRMS